MKTVEPIVSFAIALVCASGCTVDVPISGVGSDESPSTASQATVGSTAKKTPGDFIRVDLAYNSAGGTCVVNGDSGGRCNLRGALAAAPRAESPVTIELAIDSTMDGDEYVMEAPLSDAGYEVVIRPACDAPAKAITGLGTSRFIQVPAGALLDLHDVTISGFAAKDEGGAILNYGTANLHGVTLSDNQVSCQSTGATREIVSCSGGAVANHGSMLIGAGTRFESNKVTATATVPTSPTATAMGGAIASDGNLVIDGAAVFALNYASGNADPGVEPVIGMISVTGLGGAVYNARGTVLVTGADQRCNFFANQAWAITPALDGVTVVSRSAGGAIASVGGMLEIASGACAFKGNGADMDADVHYEP
jgi:hypothetical protein